VTSSAYRIWRTEQRLRYGSIKAFIKEKARADNEGRLCQVLQSYAYDQNPNARHAAEDDVAPDIWEGFPWLTMVFGSGALELPDAAGLAHRLAIAVASYANGLVNGSDEIAQYLWDTDEDNGMDSAQNLARVFTGDLALGRLGGHDVARDVLQDKGDESANSPAEVDDFSAGLVLLAALLTHLYYTAQQRRVPPIARWDGDVAALNQGAEVDSGGPDDDAQASKLLIRRLLRQANIGIKKPVNDSVKAAVQTLLENIKADLTGDAPRLTLGHLRLLTEVAWYFLSLGRPIYSGWTDLLLFLTLRQGGQGANLGPLYRNLKNLPAMVAELHEVPTKASRGLDGACSDEQTDSSAEKRDHLYKEAANVLWAQGDAAKTENDDLRGSGAQAPGGIRLPPAVAFVTSFDIELDMAMWNSAKERDPSMGRSFRVILPLHLVQQVNDEGAELCLVMGEVDVARWLADSSAPDVEAELAHLRSPVNWRLVTNSSEESDLREMPIIVHLNGCPLYNIPEPASPEADRLRDDLQAAGVPVRGRAHLEHAVTIGEYLALRQSEAELIWHGYDQQESRHLNRSLPSHLMVSTLRNPRYWLSMGVPVADAAVRHRLVSQLTRERLLESTKPSGGGGRLGARRETPVPKPRIGGVAVNLRTGVDAAGLLYWAGLDQVQGDCNQLTSELRHYVAHVRDTGSDQKKPPAGGICTLPDERN
jgi:hypothetical protein